MPASLAIVAAFLLALLASGHWVMAVMILAALAGLFGVAEGASETWPGLIMFIGGAAAWFAALILFAI